MPSGKRASMREGPLAALFRKTTQDAQKGEEKAEAQPSEPEASRGRAAGRGPRQPREQARAAERPAESIVTTHSLAAQARALSLHALLRIGETDLRVVPVFLVDGAVDFQATAEPQGLEAQFVVGE